MKSIAFLFSLLTATSSYACVSASEIREYAEQLCYNGIGATVKPKAIVNSINRFGLEQNQKKVTFKFSFLCNNGFMASGHANFEYTGNYREDVSNNWFKKDRCGNGYVLGAGEAPNLEDLQTIWVM